jgi:hypothetical protein
MFIVTPAVSDALRGKLDFPFWKYPRLFLDFGEEQPKLLEKA